MSWSVSDIPPQQGRAAVVTGTGGLGFETALALARAGAEVILAGRNPAKGAESVAKIRAAAPGAEIRFEPLDLASLASVEAFAQRQLAERTSLDILVNNAGVMAPPKREATAEGFELQFGANYLGHFALTALLLPLLQRAGAPRVVSVSSIAHLQADIHFDDINWERAYRPTGAYAQSKLAMLLFALELQRRAEAAGWSLVSNAAHPGYARTELILNGPGRRAQLLSSLFGPLLGQTSARGALPQLYAAAAPEAKGGAYYGPAGFLELKGPPAPAKMTARAQDAGLARRLWEVSEALTGASMRFGN
jgi:NAD(P)-dependent dehydrogenase (short-subunit alcohol dehydrogenase family)